MITPIVNTPNKIRFVMNERPNIHAKTGREWALDGTMGDDWWTYKTYSKKPTDKVLNRDKELILRSMEIYHHHIHINNFRVKEDEF